MRRFITFLYYKNDDHKANKSSNHSASTPEWDVRRFNNGAPSASSKSRVVLSLPNYCGHSNRQLVFLPHSTSPLGELKRCRLSSN